MNLLLLRVRVDGKTNTHRKFTLALKSADLSPISVLTTEPLVHVGFQAIEAYNFFSCNLTALGCLPPLFPGKQGMREWRNSLTHYSLGN